MTVTLAPRPTYRGTTNRNRRGSSHDRAVRRAWLVETFGDGTTVACWRCAQVLTVDTVSADRIVPGAEGGTYRRGNIRPCCLGCNAETGGHLGVARKRAQRAVLLQNEQVLRNGMHP